MLAVELGGTMTPDAKTLPTTEVQIKAYGAGVKETDQIIAIQNHTATVSNMLLVVTGALWAALSAKELSVPPRASAAILVVHILACLAVLQLLVSNTNAINLRFKFLSYFSDKFYPDIEALGKQSFLDTYGRLQSIRAAYFRWGRCPGLWYFIPIATAIGSSYFLVQRVNAIFCSAACASAV